MEGEGQVFEALGVRTPGLKGLLLSLMVSCYFTLLGTSKPCYFALLCCRYMQETAAQEGVAGTGAAKKAKRKGGAKASEREQNYINNLYMILHQLEAAPVSSFLFACLCVCVFQSNSQQLAHTPTPIHPRSYTHAPPPLTLLPLPPLTLLPSCIHC